MSATGNEEYQFSEVFGAASLYEHTSSIVLDKHQRKGTRTLVTHALDYWKKADAKKRTITLQKGNTGVASFMWFPVQIDRTIHPHVAVAMKRPSVKKLEPLLPKTLVFGMEVLNTRNRQRGKGKKYLDMFVKRFESQIKLEFTHALISVEKRNEVAFQFACAVRAKMVDDFEGRALFLLDLKDFKI